MKPGTSSYKARGQELDAQSTEARPRVQLDPTQENERLLQLVLARLTEHRNRPHRAR